MTVEAAVSSSSSRGTLRICRRGKRNNICLVSFTRSEVKNAFNDDMYEDLIDLLHQTSEDETVAGIVFTGCGDYFSSGADVKTTGFDAFKPDLVSGRQTLSKPAGRFMMSLIGYPKILAAAVNGPAVGIAVTMLLHCDLVHCASTATFWSPFTRLALVPELCSSVTFVETMGLSKANELLLLGKKINSKQAMEYNIASKIIDTVNSGNDADPFHPESIGSRMCSDIDKHLLQLPLGGKTSQYFVSLIRGRRRQRMEQVCSEELLKLDERFDSGQVQNAASLLKIGQQRRRGGRNNTNSVAVRSKL